MRILATLILAAALAGAQGCTAPAASNGSATDTGAQPVVSPQPAPTSTGPTPVVNRRLGFRHGPGALIVAEDYPAAAVQARQEGTVRFRLDVSAEGRVTNCTILKSSGFSILDASTCRLLHRRARFTPATDSHGNLVPSSLDDQYTWKLPSGQ